jgi:hypothetical protein
MYAPYGPIGTIPTTNGTATVSVIDIGYPLRPVTNAEELTKLRCELW